MTRKEWSELKPGSRIRARMGARAHEVIGIVAGQEDSDYPDYKIFHPFNTSSKAMVCENWEVVK